MLLQPANTKGYKKTYHLKGIRRHKDDATSVHLWVDQVRNSNREDNPVLLYKPQGHAQPDECDNNLSTNDFVLALQTPLQADILKRFSNNRIVCVDNTHGTNGYDFSLITVMVIDEYGEGFPVAWCFSNREDQTLLIAFYKAIMNQVGDITPRWFMSDLAEQFYSAWVLTFGKENPPFLEAIVCLAHRQGLEGKLKAGKR